MSDTIILPGLIDPHVHLRDPGQTHKEDFFTGTSAALAGGFTTVLDMPNNAEPITTLERLEAKLASARKQIVSDVGVYFCSQGDNFDQFPEAAAKVVGLKLYLNVTTGNYVIHPGKLLDTYKAWPSDKPIVLHAEEDVSELVFKTLKEVPKRTHLAHISSRAELEFIMKAKDAGLPITCGVTPHYLFLTNEDRQERLGAYAYMKPLLKTKIDQDFLWQNMEYIDVIESDHAPHTKAEKDSDNPPFGVPGLETTLPLMLTAEAEDRITRPQLLERLHTNPARIFDVPIDDTKIEVDMSEYEIKDEALLTKCGWSPFAGRRVIGKVAKTVIRGETVFENGKVLTKPGSGKILC